MDNNLEPDFSTILRYSISAYERVAITSISAFEEYFRSALATPAPPYKRYDITCGRNLITTERGESRDPDGVWAGPGLYLIASNYQHALSDPNECRLSIGGLPVIYRGQADAVKRRLQGHLFNKQYRARFGNAALERCLKLDEVEGNKGGINLDEEPYSKSKWIVVVLPMKGASGPIREFAEWGFDRAWGRPVASKETKKNPHKVGLDNGEDH